jgi:type II secretory pathway component GspD/PulD (secretin)
MNVTGTVTGRTMRFAGGIFGVALVLSGGSLWAQTPETAPPDKTIAAYKQENPPARVDLRPMQTFYLANTSQQNDGNEVTVAIRNMLPPDIKVYYVPSQNALIVRATPDQLAMAQKIINDLDRPRKAYRLVYTVTESDGEKRVGTQHYSMIVAAGQRTVMKQGSKVPIATGSSRASASSEALTQFTYLDIGMNFDATLDEFANGVRLRTKVEQLGVAEQMSGVGAQDPVIRQSSLEGTSFLSVGKPLVLGSMDIPGSTRHMDVEVVMEAVK